MFDLGIGLGRLGARVWARFWRQGLAVVLVLALPAGALHGQSMRAIDPNAAIDGDLLGEPVSPPPPMPEPAPEPRPALDLPSPAGTAAPAPAPATAANQPRSTTYAQDDLIGAAENLFGRGAEGLARLIERILADQGEPNAYIVGREGGGAFVLGVRYGSGTLYHKVEGNQPVYWTGPSVGLDAGANAANTFVLVYNLYDTNDLFTRFPAGEGQAYLLGGFHASYLRRGDIVLIPIRVGAGLRLGVNAGYMRFSRHQRWLPF